jgi:hypothetical protein
MKTLLLILTAGSALGLAVAAPQEARAGSVQVDIRLGVPIVSYPPVVVQRPVVVHHPHVVHYHPYWRHSHHRFHGDHRYHYRAPDVHQRDHGQHHGGAPGYR